MFKVKQPAILLLPSLHTSIALYTLRKSSLQAQYRRLLKWRISLTTNIFAYRLQSRSSSPHGTGLGTATASEAIIKVTAMTRDSKVSCMIV